MQANPPANVNDQGSEDQRRDAAATVQIATSPVVTAAQAIGIAPKAGFTTTEFYVVIGVILLVTYAGFADRIPPTLAGILAVAASFLYQALRVLAKSDHNTQFANLVGTILNAQALLPGISGGTPLPLSGPDANSQAKTLSDSKIEPSSSQSAPPAPLTGVGGFAGVRALFLVLGSSLLVLTSCTTAQRAAMAVDADALQAALASPAARAIEGDALQIGLQLAGSALAHGSMDEAWSSPVALNSLVNDVASLPVGQGGQTIASAVNLFAGNNPQVSAAASQLATAYVSRNPQTAVAKAAAVVALANGVSKGLSAATAPQTGLGKMPKPAGGTPALPESCALACSRATDVQPWLRVDIGEPVLIQERLIPQFRIGPSMQDLLMPMPEEEMMPPVWFHWSDSGAEVLVISREGAGNNTRGAYATQRI